jgi:hypothetical protein
MPKDLQLREEGITKSLRSPVVLKPVLKGREKGFKIVIINDEVVRIADMFLETKVLLCLFVCYG